MKIWSEIMKTTKFLFCNKFEIENIINDAQSC